MRRLMILAAFLALSAAPADAADNVKVGLLDCVVAGGTGFIIGSNKRLSCTFHPSNGGRGERYYGSVRKIGLDIGRTKKSFIKWAVLAPTKSRYKRGALAGEYVGVSGEATVGVGVGANALVGGSEKSFVLQPLSVQAQEGLNLAVGLTSLKLSRGR